jgi:energy-coupling factor transporter transmembrane protein EcfT
MEDLENDELEQPTTPVQHAVKFGLILGMVSAIITVLAYVIDPTYLANMWFGFTMLFLFFGLVIYGGISYRKEIGGFMDFGPAYVHGFVVFVMIGIIGLVMNMLMHNVIDPNLKETLIESSTEQATSMMEGFGLSGDALDEAMEKQRESMEDQFSNGGMVKGFFISLLVYAVIALITGLIVRKREKISDVY